MFRPADDLPTFEELEMFKECSLMDDKLLAEMVSRLSRLQVILGMRVIVVEGDFRGLVGRVMEVGDNKVAVDVESQDHVERVNISFVRMAFRLGDQVRIKQGPHRGCTAWIVDVQYLMVSVINVEQALEVHIISSNPCIANK